jgi:hypothetical protein
MPEPRPAPGDGLDLSRRDFLTRRLPGPLAGLLGGGAATPAAAGAVAARSDPAGSVSPRDLRWMSRDGVRAALARIRARRRGDR